MHISNFSMSTSPAQEIETWKTVVQPCVASTHHPAYKIIGAAPRPRSVEDDIPIKPVTRRDKTMARKTAKRTTLITQENLFRVSMASAREEDLDVPLAALTPLERRRTKSDTSVSSASSSTDLQSIVEEEE